MSLLVIDYLLPNLLNKRELAFINKGFFQQTYFSS